MSWEYSRVYAKVWDDERFRALSEQGQRTALYLLTSAQGNGIGYFRFSPGKAAEDLGLSVSAFSRAFAEVQATMGWPFDPAARVMLLPKFFRYNTADNPNCLKAWMRELANIPSSPLFEQFAAGQQFLPEKLRPVFQAALEQYSKHSTERSPERYHEPSPEGSPQRSPEGSGEGMGEPSPHTSTNPIPKPNPIPIRTPPAADAVEFEEFWKAYPKKRGRLDAQKAFLQVKDRPPVATLVAAVQKHLVSPQWAKDGGQFIPHPATWLRQGGWQDEVAITGLPAKPRIVYT